jgi:hypothetical protein
VLPNKAAPNQPGIMPTNPLRINHHYQYSKPPVSGHKTQATDRHFLREAVNPADTTAWRE